MWYFHLTSCFSWWLGVGLVLKDHGKVPTRNWVKGSKNIMKSLLGSCLYVSSGISLNFLFYFNFHVSKLVQNKRGKKSVSWDWLYFWWLQKGSLCSKTAQFSLWVPPDEEDCLPEAETSSLPPMHVVSRASLGAIATGHEIALLQWSNCWFFLNDTLERDQRGFFPIGMGEHILP